MQLAKYLFILIVVVSYISSPASVIAGSYGVSPSEVQLEHLSPGSSYIFEICILNHEDYAQSYTLYLHHPNNSEMREGRITIPDFDIISFPKQVEVPANSDLEIPIGISVPVERDLAGKDWEVWLSISQNSNRFMTINYYIRLLISTEKQKNHYPVLNPTIIILGGLSSLWGLYNLASRRKIQLSK